MKVLIGCEYSGAVDAAIVGVRVSRRTGKAPLVYSYRKLVEIFVRVDGMTEEEAVEWVSYNTIRAIPYFAGPKQAEPKIRMDI